MRSYLLVQALQTRTRPLGSFTVEGDSSATKVVQLFHSDTLFGQQTGGAVDAIRCYNRPLTADEIVELFSAGPDGLPAVDQRGFPRPVGARSDFGAYELQITSSADFDTDGDVDGADFLAWQRGFGTTVGATRADGDSDADGDVDAIDLVTWEVVLGQPQSQPLSAVSSPPSVAGLDAVAPLLAIAADLPAADLIDAAIVLALDNGSDRQDTDAQDWRSHEPTAIERAFATSEVAALSSPSRVSDGTEWQSRSKHAGKTAARNEAWLANELLERVFG